MNDSKGMVLKLLEFPQYPVISVGAANSQKALKIRTRFIQPNPGISALADTKKNACLSDTANS